MEITEEIAELYGALLGDGCLSCYPRRYRPSKTRVIVLTGHYHDEPYYKHVIQPVFKKISNKTGYLYRKKDCQGIQLTLNCKKTFQYFENLKFPIGKKLQKIKIPSIILQSNKLSLACVRGIFDTDGSIYQRYSKQYPSHAKFYDYKNIQIKMIAKDLIQQMAEILTKNGIKINKVRQAKESQVLAITDQTSIKRFFDIIKPHNQWHIQRFKNKIASQ